MKASEWAQEFSKNWSIKQAEMGVRGLIRDLSAAEDRAEKWEKWCHAAIAQKDRAERERDEAIAALAMKHKERNVLDGDNLDLSLRLEQMRAVLEDTAYSVHRNASHSGEFEECRENGCNQIIDILSIPPGAAAREVLEALVRIANKYQETQDMMRRVGWKYEDSDNVDQKMAFSVYTDLVETCETARALLAKYGVVK